MTAITTVNKFINNEESLLFKNKFFIFKAKDVNNYINSEYDKIEKNRVTNVNDINEQATNVNLDCEKKYFIRQKLYKFTDTENFTRIDTNWLKLFPVTAYAKLPLFTKKRNFLHYYSTIYGYYRNRYTGEKFIRFNHGHREISEIAASYLTPRPHKEAYFKLRYYYWNKYAYLFYDTLSFYRKIITWNVGLDYDYHALKLNCTLYHNLLY